MRRTLRILRWARLTLSTLLLITTVALWTRNLDHWKFCDSDQDATCPEWDGTAGVPAAPPRP